MSFFFFFLDLDLLENLIKKYIISPRDMFIFVNLTYFFGGFLAPLMPIHSFLQRLRTSVGGSGCEIHGL